jgi:pilus assembly protein TadC
MRVGTNGNKEDRLRRAIKAMNNIIVKPYMIPYLIIYKRVRKYRVEESRHVRSTDVASSAC